MEWWLAGLIIFGGLTVALTLGLPVAFSFLLITLIGAYVYWGGESGLNLLILSIFESLTRFTLLPIPLFILMGELMFQSGMAYRMIDALDKWLGRLPGRLGLLAVVAGTLLSTTSGSSMASGAILGSTLVPEMEKRGYKKPMSLGPILGSGGLAIMIPPSGLAVLLAAVAEISVGRLLIAGIVPGLLMAALYASYIVGRCWLQPSIAPPYAVTPTPLSEKAVLAIKYVLPLGFIVLSVIGLIFLGVATPSEAAAMGALTTLILSAFYKGLNWQMMKKSLMGTARITLMVLLIISAAVGFSQILAISGFSQGLVALVIGLPVTPTMLIVIMMVAVLIMGTFLGANSLIMLSVPIFMPIVNALGFNPIWFGALMLLNIEMSITTPPYGGILFVLKGVAPPDTTMGDIFRAPLPFLACDAIVMALMIAFPMVTLWLPGVML